MMEQVVPAAVTAAVALASPGKAAAAAVASPPASPAPDAAAAAVAPPPVVAPAPGADESASSSIGGSPSSAEAEAAAAAGGDALDTEARTKAFLRGQSALDLSKLLAPVVICGPSGVGKGTIIGELMARHPDKFAFCVSHTTRDPRPGEVNGQHYHFVGMDAMKAAVEKGAFLEHAHVHGNIYGTSLAAVAAVSSAGKVAILDIDVQGAEQVRASCLGSHCLFVFIAPPSHEELERRLRGRGTETEDKVLKRLAGAKAEIEKSKTPGLFNRTIVNEVLDAAVLEMSAIIDEHLPGTIPGAAEALRLHEAAAAAAADKPAEKPAAAAPAAAAEPAAAPAAAAPAAAAPAPAAAPAAAAPALALPGLGLAAAPKTGMPVRAYMDATVVPVLREGLKALNVARPEDPLQFLADFLLEQRRRGAPAADAAAA